MPACELIVCEKTPHWAAALKAELAGRPPRVVEVRTLTACESALTERGAALVAVETTASNLEAVLSLLLRIGRQFPAVRSVAMVAPELTDREQLLEEAGAIAVIQSILEAPRLARMARRQWSLFPAEDQPFSDWVSERLPWPAHSTTSS